MLQPIPVHIAAYNPAWPQIAAQYTEQLKALDSISVIHHIGSTSVPGLAAKPIIDLMPLAHALDVLDRERMRVEALGYDWHGELGISGRRYCTLHDENGTRIVQLHFFQKDSPHAERHLAFRNYLRTHPETSQAYEHEKRRARELHPNDSHAYNDEKSAWIRSAEIRALAWYRGNSASAIT